MRPHWFFVDQSNGATKPWRWRRLLLAGEAVTTSEFYEDFGQVVYSAMKVGFSPRQEPWVVFSENGETLFEATTEPQGLVEAGIDASTSRDELSADGSAGYKS
jgi:hypothetical protein